MKHATLIVGVIGAAAVAAVILYFVVAIPMLEKAEADKKETELRNWCVKEKERIEDLNIQSQSAGNEQNRALIDLINSKLEVYNERCY